jgi:hypothetical protein
VHRVFTRIRSGASLEASSGGARGFVAWARWKCARVANFWLDLFQPSANGEDEKPKGIRFLFISQPVSW